MAGKVTPWSTPNMIAVLPSTDLVVNSVTVASDITITNATKGVILTDASSDERRITVNTDGSLTISDPIA